jgi:hypothetical protein
MIRVIRVQFSILDFKSVTFAKIIIYGKEKIR